MRALSRRLGAHGAPGQEPNWPGVGVGVGVRTPGQGRGTHGAPGRHPSRPGWGWELPAWIQGCVGPWAGQPEVCLSCPGGWGSRPGVTGSRRAGRASSKGAICQPIPALLQPRLSFCLGKILFRSQINGWLCYGKRFARKELTTQKGCQAHQNLGSPPPGHREQRGARSCTRHGGWHDCHRGKNLLWLLITGWMDMVGGQHTSRNCRIVSEPIAEFRYPRLVWVLHLRVSFSATDHECTLHHSNLRAAFKNNLVISCS